MAPPADADPPRDASPLPLTYDPAAGRLFLMGEPTWFVSPEFYLDLQTQLEALSGKAAKGILYRVSFSAGVRSAKRMAGPVAERDDLEERLQQVADFTSLTGFGRYRFEVTDRANAGTNWILRDSPLATLHAKSAEPVCHLYAGFLAGWLTTLFDRPVECTEYECRAKGDPRCAFRTRPARATPI